MKDRLCALALAAMEDPSVAGVLVDAILEADWWDERLDEDEAPLLAMGAPRPPLPPMCREEFIGAVRFAPMTIRSRCRSIAAVLLFGDWPTQRWELAAGCRKFVRMTGGTLTWTDGNGVRQSVPLSALNYP